MAFFVAVLGVLWAVFVWQATEERNRLVEDCRRRGEPLLPEELEGLYPFVPDSENAASDLIRLWARSDPDYWHAFAARSAKPGSKIDLSVTNVPLVSAGMTAGSYRRSWEVYATQDEVPGEDIRGFTEETLKAALHHLEENSDYLMALKQALAKPRCRFPIRFEDGSNMLLPHLAELRDDARLLRLQALMAADSGDRETAFENVIGTIRIAKHLSGDPLLISHLIVASTLGIASDSLEEVFSRTAPTDEELAGLTRLLAEFSVRDSLRLSFYGERAMFMDLLTLDSSAIATLINESDGDMSEADAGYMILAFRLFAAVGLTQKDTSLALRTYREATELLILPIQDWSERHDALFFDAADRALKFPYRLLSGMMLPGLGKAAEKLVKMEARLRATMLTIEFEQYRIRHGHWPQTIEELGLPSDSRIATDPFTGEPMKVRQLKHGFVIYSLGPDRTDEGGRGILKSPSSAPYDISFILERKDAAD